MNFIDISICYLLHKSALLEVDEAYQKSLNMPSPQLPVNLPNTPKPGEPIPGDPPDPDNPPMPGDPHPSGPTPAEPNC